MFGSLLQPMWNSCWAHRWRSINICWMNERTTFGAFAPVYQCCLSSSKNSLRPTTFYSSNTKPHPNTLCTVRPSPAEGSTPTPMQSVGSYAKHVPNTSCILPENFKVSVSAPRKGSRCHVGPILWTPPPPVHIKKTCWDASIEWTTWRHIPKEESARSADMDRENKEQSEECRNSGTTITKSRDMSGLPKGWDVRAEAAQTLSGEAVGLEWASKELLGWVPLQPLTNLQ